MSLSITFAALVVAFLIFHWRRRDDDDTSRVARTVLLFVLVGFPLLLATWQTGENRKLKKPPRLSGDEHLNRLVNEMAKDEQERQRNAIAATTAAPDISRSPVAPSPR